MGATPLRRGPQDAINLNTFRMLFGKHTETGRVFLGRPARPKSGWGLARGLTA
jgi:hypothetical protein